MHLQSTEHAYRKDSFRWWTKWEQLRRAVQEGSTSSWAGREAKTRCLLQLCSNPVHWCTGDNEFPRWRSQYGSCTGTRKDRQLAHLVPHRVCGCGGGGEKIFFFLKKNRFEKTRYTSISIWSQEAECHQLWAISNAEEETEGPNQEPARHQNPQ